MHSMPGLGSEFLTKIFAQDICPRYLTKIFGLYMGWPDLRSTAGLRQGPDLDGIKASHAFWPSGDTLRMSGDFTELAGEKMQNNERLINQEIEQPSCA